MGLIGAGNVARVDDKKEKKKEEKKEERFFLKKKKEAEEERQSLRSNGQRADHSKPPCEQNRIKMFCCYMLTADWFPIDTRLTATAG